MVSRQKSLSIFKGKGKTKVLHSNVISITAKESDFEANKLTNSEDEVQDLAINPMVAATRSKPEFTKDYDKALIDPPKVVPTPAEAAAGPPEPVGPHVPPPPPRLANATDR